MKFGILVTMIVLVLSMLTGVALADQPEVSVNASATVYMQPERVMFSVGVSETAPSVVEAQSKVNKTISSVIEALIDAGIPRKDISASYLSVYSEYNYNSSPPTIVGYNATHQLDVKTTDIENVGSIIDAALNAGANQFNSVQFGVVDGSESYREALKLAVEAAKEKALVLADASGMKLGALVSIEEQPTYSIYDGGYSNALRAEEDSAGGTEVMTGNISVTASVVAVYELAKP